MRVSSFDIFDTCLVRKCGVPRNLFDILSYMVFSKEVSKEVRLEFVTQRLSADESSTIHHIYDTFNYTHPLLLSKDDLIKCELDCERIMMVPVFEMLGIVNQCRNNGDHIVFISDMYLPTNFLKEALSSFGFFKKDDLIYVSGDCGLKKSDGSLYHYIKEKKNLEYSEWHHYGDNPTSDNAIPSKLGITTHIITHPYLPYQFFWKDSSNDISYHIGGIMAGIGRSIIMSLPYNEHNAFATDITAPLTTTFAMRIMKDASNRGIKRLFFCSRDCYALYYVAKKLTRILPNIEPIYFHTSRKALYGTNEDELIGYLKHIGLASKDSQIGIVDIRTTGKSLQYLNQLLVSNGYRQLFGYYLEMFCSNFFTNVSPYYCEVNRLYCDLFDHHYPILEKFLALSPEYETVEYKNNEPIYDKHNINEDYKTNDLELLSSINLNILSKYADFFIDTELYRHTNDIFFSFVIPTLKGFFNNPHKEYLKSLKNFTIRRDNGSYLPYIEELPSGTPLKIAKATQNTKNKYIRRILKTIMKVWHIKPLPTEIWWPEGTKAYNS